MSGSIVFIDDDAGMRRTYRRKLRRIFLAQEGYKIVCPDLKRDMREMIYALNEIDNKVTYFIDEDLMHVGIASYKGTELIEKIRVNEPNIPIYIITSNLSWVDEHLGDIEFAIDKNRWDEEHDKYAQRFLRHINTFKTIKSEQAARFDELFAKSLDEPLTEEETEEYKALNVMRSKTLVDEDLISEESVAKLDQQAEELAVILAELKELRGEQ
ncbi:hypothetical protein [Vibrio owensii]